MPKGVPNKRYTPEFKRMVVEAMKKRTSEYLCSDAGLELTRHYVSPCCPVSRSTANKTSVEVVHVRQR